MAARSSPQSDGSDPPNKGSKISKQLISDDAQIEKALARVAEIVGKAFLHFRENTFDNGIDHVVVKANEIITYDNDEKDYKFYPFPDHLVKDGSTKKALLMALMCMEPAGYMYNLLTKLFKGLDISVQEAQVHFPKPRLTVTAFRSDGEFLSNAGKPHEFLVMTSNKSKQQWAIDVTGAQYGIFQSFWKWSDYQTDNFIDRSKTKMYEFGHAKSRISEESLKPGRSFLIYGISGDIISKLDLAVDAWESGNMELSELRMLEDQYDRHHIALQVALSREVKGYVSTLDFGAREKASMQNLLQSHDIPWEILGGVREVILL